MKNILIIKARKKVWFKRDPYKRFAKKDRHFNPKGRTIDNIVIHRYILIRFWQDTKWYKEKERIRELTKISRYKYGLLIPELLFSNNMDISLTGWKLQ